MENPLFSPFALGGIRLSNRMVMAPMTRSRATPDNRPGDSAITYYRQRASAGLIVTEGTQTSLRAKGFPRVPGLFSPKLVEDWRRVTEAVHEAGGHIYTQLWHCGRISDARCQPGGEPPCAPSAIRAEANIVLDDGTRIPAGMPRAFESRELPLLVEEFVSAARNAIAAGFDGVELHAANGYLLHQFLSESTNQRTDGYGTTIGGRIRFVVETAEAVSAAIGAGRTGIRFSPLSRYNAIAEPDPTGLYSALIAELDRIGLVYVHMVEGQAGTTRESEGFDFAGLRRRFGGAWIANNMYDREMAEAALRRGDADLVSFGRPFIANPDLVERYRARAPLNAIDLATAYAGGDKGYIDYPAMGEEA